MELAQPQPQPKRTRRPSVRLGEIGDLGFPPSWLESKRRKQPQPEEEWSVVEPVVAAASPVVVATPAGKRRSGGGRLRWTGSKVRGRQEDDATVGRSERLVDAAESPENGDEAPFRAATSSDSDGGGLKEHPGNGASEGANPNSHGDEMQGAIEDGPDGRGFRTGERRSGRQVAWRKHRIGSRDAVSRDTSAGEPVGAPVANGTTDVTPSFGERIALSAGVNGWLEELGLGKYAELFEQNEVDTEVLPLLTMDDLREMGVDAVGARRKMFSNLQGLCGI